MAIALASASAQNITWSNTGTDYNAGASWSGGSAPGSTNNATFSGTATTQPNLTANRTNQAVFFSANGSGYTLSANEGIFLTLSGTTPINAANTSGTNTVSANLILGGAAASNQRINQAAGGSLVLSGNISSTNAIANLNFTGVTGTVITLSGNNTYSGNTSLSGGVYNINSANAISSGTLILGGGTTIANTSGAPVVLQNNNISIGTNTFRYNSSASLSFGNGTLSFSGDRLFELTSGGTLTIGSLAADAITSNFTVTSNGTFVIRNAASANFQDGFSGSGTIIVGDKAALGTGTFTAQNVSLQAFRPLDGAMTMSNTVIANQLTVSGNNSIEFANKVIGNTGSNRVLTSSISGGTLVLNNVDISNDTVTARTLTINGTGNTTINGVIANGVGTTTANLLTINSNGTTILSGNNTYTGITTVNAGTLRLAKTAALYNGTVASWTAANMTVNNGGTLALNVGGTGEFSTGNVTTLLTNLGGLGGAVNNNGLRSGSVIGFDTTNAVGNFTIADIIANSTGTGGGSIGLNKLGSGTLILTGNNTYTGATTISAGTLSISAITNGGVAGALGNSTNAATNLVFRGGALEYTGANGSTNRNFTLTNGTASTIRVTNSTATLTISGAAAAGNGSLTKAGSGTLMLTGANAYSGGTTISAGTLGFTSGALGNTGSISVNGGSLQWGASNTEDISSRLVMSNAGSATLDTGSNSVTLASGFGSASSSSLTKTGSGTLILSGSNTYTGSTMISAGTLQIGAGGTSGDISSSASITNNATLVFNRSDDFSYGNGIAGSGALIKNGFGTLTLSGSNTNTGAVQVNAGTLLLSGANALSASTSSLNATSGATISLADGTTRNSTISGTMSLNASAFIFDLIGSDSDRLNITGAASLIGTNTVNLNISSFSAGTWTLLTAASGLDGTWALGTSAPSGFSFSLSSNATTLTLTAAASTSDYYWTGNENSSWAGANWSGSISGTGPSLSGSSLDATNDVKFAATGAGNLSTTLGADYTIKTLSITTDGVSINGNNTLTVNSTGPTSISIADNGGMTTINAALAGAAGLTKSGTGTLVLGGTNTYTGGTTLSAGTIQIASDAALGNSSVTFNAGLGNTATLQAAGNLTLASSRALTISTGTASFETQGFHITANSSIGGGGTLEKNGSGTLTLAGTNTYSGGTTISSGNLTITGGSAIADGGRVSLANVAGVGLNVNSSETIGSLQGGGTIGGTVAIASGQTLTVNDTGVNTFAGVVAGAGRLSKTGSGTLTLSGANTYSGGTTLAAGQLNINNANSIGSGTLTITGGTIDNTSGAVISLAANNAQNWNGNFTFAGTNDLNLGAGAVAMNASRTITVSAGNLTSGGAISGAGIGLTKAGAGTLILSGNNTYTGTTTISAGTLKLTGAGVLGAGNYSANITNTGRLVFESSTNQILGGVISGTGGLLTMSGSGQLTLNGGNTFTGGVTLNSGTLVIGQATALGNGTFTINGGVISSLTSRTVSNAQSWAGDFALSGAGLIFSGAITLGGNRTVTVDASGPYTLSNSISGIGFGLTKNGSGTLIVTNDNNAYTGTTTINAGTLQIGSGGNTGALSTSSAIINNATLVFNRSNDIFQGGNFSSTISGTGSLTKNGAGNLTLNGANTYTVATIVNSGVLNLSGGSAVADTSAVIVSSGATLNLLTSETVGSISGAGNIILGSATITAGADNSSTNFSGVISGTGGLTKAGSGSLTLAGNNTFSGNMVINGGVLEASASGSLGGTGNVTVNGGSLLVSADDAINGKNVTLNSNSTTVAGLVFSGNYNGTIGRLTLSADSIIDLGGGSVAASFTDIAMGIYNLSIYNWTGTTLWGGTNRNNTDQIYVVANMTDNQLSRISFYSDFGNSFLGTGFQLKGSGFYDNQVIPVPEPETWATGVLLLMASSIWFLKSRRQNISAALKI